MSLKKIIAFACSAVFALHGMETENDTMYTMLKPLPKETRIKILACVDWETKVKMYCFWPEMFECTMNDLMQESPVMVSRKCFLFHLIDMAKSNSKDNFCKALKSAAYCNSETFFFDMRFFLPESDSLKIIETYTKQKDVKHKNNNVCESILPHIKEILPDIMQVCRGGQKVWDQFMGYPKSYETPLHMAIHKSYSNVVIELLALQSSTWLNVEERDSKTPLFEAVAMGKIEPCKILLSFEHIQMNKACRSGRFLKEKVTPLIYAASDGNFKLVQMLIKRGADVNYQTAKNKYTALYFTLDSLKRNKTNSSDGTLPPFNKIINFLLQQPNFKYGPHDEKFLDEVMEEQKMKRARNMAELQHQSEEKAMMQLIWAVSDGKFITVQKLVQGGADINHRTPEGYTALYFALKNEKINNNETYSSSKIPNTRKIINFLLDQPNLIYGPHDKKLLDEVMEMQNPKNEDEKTNDQKTDNCVCM